MKSIFKKKEEAPKPQSNSSDAAKPESVPRTGNLFGFKSLGAKSKSDSQEGLKQKAKSGYSVFLYMGIFHPAKL